MSIDRLEAENETLYGIREEIQSDLNGMLEELDSADHQKVVAYARSIAAHAARIVAAVCPQHHTADKHECYYGCEWGIPYSAF